MCKETKGRRGEQPHNACQLRLTPRPNSLLETPPQKVIMKQQVQGLKIRLDF